MPAESNRKIALFHHARLSGGDPPIDFSWASSIFAEQIIALRDSGLTDAASEIYIGVNGGEQDAFAAQSMAPEKAQVIQHPDDARGELPTLNLMWNWARKHPGWLVYYCHTKGATHHGDQLYANWRRCMERACVHNWQRCVKDLEAGAEAVGCHWLTDQKYSNVGPPFFGGNFYWATADFLMTLPEIPRTARDRGMFYEAEVWLAKGPRLPRIRDYAPHWPGAKCAP